MTGDSLLNAAHSALQGSKARAEANLEVYLTGYAGVAEHPDVVKEVIELTKQIVEAEEAIKFLEQKIMRFINIKGFHNEDIAINVSNISSIKESGNYIIILISGDPPITTQFTDIASAVDYIQRASSMSLEKVA